MSDDLVKRLRTGEPCYKDKCPMMNANSGCICAEAADEIEYLKRIIANLLDDGDEIDRAEARAALEGEKKDE